MARRKLRADAQHAAPVPRIAESCVAQAVCEAPADLVALQPEINQICVREFDNPHDLERLVLHELLAQQNVTFSSLVIRRMADGLCLQGVIECEDDEPDVCTLAKRVANVDRVVSQLVVRRRQSQARAAASLPK